MRNVKLGSLLGSLGMIIALAACGGSTAPASGSPPASSAAGGSGASSPSGASASASTAGGLSPELAKIVDAAKKEPVIKGVWSESSFGGSAGFQELVGAVNKKYGLNLKAQFTPGEDMQALMARVAQEVAAGQPSTTDVLLSNSQGVHDASPSKAFKPVDWQKLEDKPVPGEQGFDPVSPDNYALAISSAVTGVTYNSKLIPADSVPHKLNDLLDPKWKGKIASTPYAAGFRDFAAPEVLGKQAVLDYVSKFSQNIGGLIRCGDSSRLSSGEFLMLALDCGNDGAFVAQRQGAPISQVILDDGTSLHLRYAGVPATSNAPNAATLIVLFLDTPEGQQFLYKYDGMDLHTFPNSHMKSLVDKVRSAGGKVWTDTVQNLNAFSDYSQNQKQIVDILQKGVPK